MEWALGILLALGAYLLGSIPTAYIVVRFQKGTDIRDLGSRNVGALNTFHQVGLAGSALVLAVDAAKGALAMLTSDWIGAPQWSIFAVAISVMVGHNWPVFLGFRGGKGVITGLGVFLALLPFEALGSLTVFIITVSVSRYISLGSMAGAVAMFMIMVAETVVFSDSAAPHWAYLILSAALAGIIVYRHRDNIRRIRDGTEPKFSMSRPDNKQTL